VAALSQLSRGDSRRLAVTHINILKKPKTLFTNMLIRDILILKGGIFHGADWKATAGLA
jgi:formaldehyde-activating enzyme involved in methanogenesis